MRAVSFIRIRNGNNSPDAVEMQMPLYQGFVQLGAGLSVGLAGLAAGFAIGIVGDAGVRGTAQQPRLFVGMVSKFSMATQLRLTVLTHRFLFSFSPKCWVFTVSNNFRDWRLVSYTSVRSDRCSHHELEGKRTG